MDARLSLPCPDNNAGLPDLHKTQHLHSVILDFNKGTTSVAFKCCYFKIPPVITCKTRMLRFTWLCRDIIWVRWKTFIFLCNKFMTKHILFFFSVHSVEFQPRLVLLTVQTLYTMVMLLVSDQSRQCEQCVLFGLSETMLASCVLVMQLLKASIQMVFEVCLWS